DNAQKLQDDLEAIWPETHPDDKLPAYQFLYHAKQWQVFLFLFRKDISERSAKVPWDLFLRLILNLNIVVPEEHDILIKKVLKKQRIIARKSFTVKEMIAAIVLKRKYAFMQDLQDKRQELLSSANIAKSERLFDQQIQFLKELKKLFPNDINVKQILFDREKIDAEQVLQKALRANRRSTYTPRAVDEDEKASLEHLSQQAKHILDTHPELAHDFAIMFRQFGSLRIACDFLYLEKDSESRDWQLLDLLLIDRQYLALLDHAEQLKLKYSNQPLALFSISYAEALAYWELGEKSKAIQLMGQIANMKPDFKSASDLLIEWKEDHLE
ncbi:MAG: hypothetical protein KDD33_11840, partial [Bdellovibrionales bacterium]|nr:hypothetical protein [Bdellovibrionales bacterium]